MIKLMLKPTSLVLIQCLKQAADNPLGGQRKGRTWWTDDKRPAGSVQAAQSPVDLFVLQSVAAIKLRSADTERLSSVTLASSNTWLLHTRAVQFNKRTFRQLSVCSVTDMTSDRLLPLHLHISSRGEQKSHPSQGCSWLSRQLTASPWITGHTFAPYVCG